MAISARSLSNSPLATGAAQVPYSAHDFRRHAVGSGVTWQADRSGAPRAAGGSAPLPVAAALRGGDRLEWGPRRLARSNGCWRSSLCPRPRWSPGRPNLITSLGPRPLANHALRTWAFGCVLGLRDGLTFDREVLALAALLHDLGLARRTPETTCFAADGAIQAVELLRDSGRSGTGRPGRWRGHLSTCPGGRPLGSRHRSTPRSRRRRPGCHWLTEAFGPGRSSGADSRHAPAGGLQGVLPRDGGSRGSASPAVADGAVGEAWVSGPHWGGPLRFLTAIVRRTPHQGEHPCP